MATAANKTVSTKAAQEIAGIMPIEQMRKRSLTYKTYREEKRNVRNKITREREQDSTTVK